MQQTVQIQPAETFVPPRFTVYQHRQIDKIEALHQLPEHMRFEMKVVASVFPFRVNNFVIEELIDWDKVPNDPVFQLTFPQRGMLDDESYEQMAALHRTDPTAEQVMELAQQIRNKLNPHPAGQMEKNVPELDGERVEGIQHKYKETVLFFPAQGQYCHSYCTFCFRWAQFVGKATRFNNNDADLLHNYLREHKEVTDLLVTGGDPMVMRTVKLRGYLEKLKDPEFDHIRTIRIGTKSLTFWPFRYLTDPDAQDLLALIKELVDAGKHVSIMAHINHKQELRTAATREAIALLRKTGAQIRTQAPLLNNINTDPNMWAEMWKEQTQLGMIPYYMFIERDTGAKRYFELPLYKTWETFREAYKQVSGVSRTVRGPSMSAGPGKVEVSGVSEIAGEKVFVLRFIQARNPDWVQRPFFAKYDENATWLNDLKPAFGEEKFFWEDEYNAM
ncbi:MULTISPECIES: KamA family radical SAM protein [Pseudoalteromonas]|uniref:Lysine 2,3-aminomutase n=1 Tax=Pseudoalteromonas ruthenica TaxID=151081 RepID=A0A5S3Z856_9GAMM|nr:MULTISPECIES: lysine 2,3-aminomutase [Pseudoalteromonas]MCF2861537.1 lysine 2,3-aminomutase [Pseudoalteromonas sp. CNAT2-18]MCG7542695.1 lysine 2,3-aminomutase [Pseudoalteromonas sp. MM17-2]MCG7557425.1 lysine 2,3-aminomutase [Pseudoalteromonas sp. CNAT2-18.1]MCG7565016.1 lysine 2,3-aminomutase [Pseudoalteromonas sp. CnMc7-15]MCG7568665.1 lysine 2,3-aminomutase [Pseudoalteromonas sp. CNC9-20]|tara:strand:+ start:2124 stop:3461 length:1338 start_codon:yes stop_codon:yes gene_type:complete